MEEELFTEFIQKICKRPSMYIGSGSATETIAFICGYSYGKNTPISDRVFLMAGAAESGRVPVSSLDFIP